MGEAFIRQIFTGVCGGLREVHANKLLHLDLKPANIYLRIDGTPILLDFGAARQTINNDVPKLYADVHAGLRAARAVFEDGDLGPWSDIYSIGARCTPAWSARRRSRPTSAAPKTRWKTSSQAGRTIRRSWSTWCAGA